MNQYKNISMSDNKDTSIDLKSNEACFLQRLVELNLKDERNTSLIVYPLYTIVTVIMAEEQKAASVFNLRFRR